MNIQNIGNYEYFIEDGALKAVNRSTGEVVDAVEQRVPTGSIIITPESREAYQRYKQLKAKNEYKKSANNELGAFYFLSYSEQFSDISPQSAARLIFLNTFSDYETNTLFISNRNGKTPITRKDLSDILGISKALVSNFWHEVSPKYISESAEGLLTTNTGIFHRCKLPKGKYMNLQKLYINGIRKLYRETDASKHKHLGYILQMLPYINIEFNILCKNPFEENLDNIQPLTISEFCDIIGYDSSHLNRLKKIYYDLRFEVKNKRERFCSFVYDGIHSDDVRIFVNPRILYNGSDYRKVEVLGVFCK